MADTSTPEKPSDQSQPAGRKNILLIGFTADQVKNLTALLPQETALKSLSSDEFSSSKVDELSKETLGCIFLWRASDSNTKDIIRIKQTLWQFHGVGLCLIGEIKKPSTIVLMKEIGVEDHILSLNEETKIKQMVQRWQRYSTRQYATVLRLTKEIEACFESQNYEKSRQIIDSLVLIDPRKRVYMNLLGQLMYENQNFPQAEECLRRSLIHWPSHIKSLSILCEMLKELKKFKDAADMGKKIIDAFDTNLIEAIIGSEVITDTDDFFTELPQTKRLLDKIYGLTSMQSFIKSYAAAIKHGRSNDDDLTILMSILKQTADDSVLNALADILPIAKKTAVNAANTDSQTPDSASSGQQQTLPPLAIQPPSRKLSDSELLSLIGKSAKDPPDFVMKNDGVNEIVYKNIVAIFHPENQGYKRLAKIFNTIGCDLIEGYHEPEIALDRLRAVKIDILVLWYQEGQEQTLDLLREVNESRDLYQPIVWVLSPSQSAQIQFATKAQGLFFLANDIVRWQRGQFEDDFKKLLAKAKAPTNMGNVLHALRHPWSEGAKEPPSLENCGKILASVLKEFAKDPRRAYWLKAEEVLHTLRSGGDAAAVNLATSLQSAFPDVFDAKLIYALAQAKAASDKPFIELVEWMLGKKMATPERSLRLARILLRENAASALLTLVNALFKIDSAGKIHQHHAAAACYHLLAKQKQDAAAHLVKAIELAPRRIDYLNDLAGILEPNDANRAADIWDIAARQEVLPRWYCLYRAGEMLLQAGHASRAQFMLKDSLKEHPASTEVQNLLNEAQSQKAS